MHDDHTINDGRRYVLATLGADAESFDVEAIVTDVREAVGSWDFTRLDNDQDEASYVDYWRIVARHQDDQLTPNDQDEARPDHVTYPIVTFVTSISQTPQYRTEPAP